jgi:hypothetical protein
VSINADKGDQAIDGYDARVVSDIGNGIFCPDAPRYVLLRRTLHFLHAVKADSHGTLWIFFGTESGYESVTALYYRKH